MYVRVELSLTARVEVVRHRSFSVAVRWQLRLGYSIHVDRALAGKSGGSELTWSNTTCRYAFSVGICLLRPPLRQQG